MPAPAAPTSPSAPRTCEAELDALAFFDVETATATTAVNLGFAAPHSSADKPLRVVNTNDTYQAEDVTVTVGSDHQSIQLWLSLDGENFLPSITIGDIPPGGPTDTFWLRRATPARSPLGGRSGALPAAAAAWIHPMDASITDNLPVIEDPEE